HGRLDLALAQHEHALAVQQREPPALHTIQTVNAIAVTLGLMGRYPEAIARLREGLALADQLRSTTYEQFLKGSLAGVYLQSGRHREAADLLEDVLKQPNPPQAATRWAQLSSARSALGESEAALVAAERGLALAATTDIDTLTAILRARISALTALGRYDDANTDLTRLLTMIERVRESTLPADYLRRGYGARHQDVFAAAVKLRQAQGRPREALETAERARSRAFLDLLASRGAGAAATRAAARGTAASFEQMTATARRLDSTILAFWVGDSTTTAWLVSPTGQLATVVIPVTAVRLTTLVQEALRGTTMESSGLVVSATAAARPWRALSAALLDPIRSKLPRRIGSRLTIIPHGPLFSVPFAALPSASGRYLIESYDLHYVPAVGVLTYTTGAHVEGPRRAALLVGDPTPVATPDPALAVTPLPWADREVRDLDRQFGHRATLLTKADATEAKVRNALGGAAVLHFATHAVVRNEQGLTSYLALAPSQTPDRLTADDDGRLTADELYGLRLDADLVVLSGCGTALGPVSGEGVIGFTRAFLAAGASSVVATMWDVADRTTFETMRAFYQRRQTGTGTSRSLRHAQLAMLAALRSGRVVVNGRALAEHPRLWAAYVLVGEP
ncbi:MAG: CHAT domain-containing protein, partial [Vicinamibacterales bacterium]